MSKNANKSSKHKTVSTQASGQRKRNVRNESTRNNSVRPVVPKKKSVPVVLDCPNGIRGYMIRTKAAEKISNGYPLIVRNDLLESFKSFDDDGRLIWLFDDKGRFIATAYGGIQNKGIGWVIDAKKRTVLSPEFFVSLFKAACDERKHLPDESTTAYRWFNGEGDGFGGLTIDRYNGYYVFTWYSKGCYKYKDDILKAFNRIVDRYDGIYFKRRFETGGQYLAGEDFVSGKPVTGPIVVKENDLNYAVHLDDGPMVGIFLDQRHVRKAIKERYGNGREVLNTFSYTGAFSIAAYAGGAKSTVSVDLANRSLPKTTEQFEVNGFELTDNSIIVEDVFQYFKYAARKELQFDLVILDPPSHAKSKKMIFAAEKNYTMLMEDAIRITRKNGIIIASTNCASFGIKEFKVMIINAFENMGVGYKILETLGQPEDFRVRASYPEGAYLKVLVVECI